LSTLRAPSINIPRA
jgi:hypothetical protein